MPSRYFPELSRGGSVYEWALRVKAALLPVMNIAGDGVTADVSDVGSALIVRARFSAVSKKTLSLVSINQTDKTARISGGTIDRGDADGIVIAGPVDVLVSGGTESAPVWVYVEWDMDTLEAEIPEIAMATRPKKEGKIFRRPLCSFYSEGEGDDQVITLKSTHHDGDIFAAQIAM